MSHKQLWSIIAGLILLNVVTILVFVIKPLDSAKTAGFGGDEAVAKVGDTQISRAVWMKALEDRYGKEVLSDLVDDKVIRQAAEKYKVKVTDNDVEREYKVTKTMYGASAQNNKSAKQWKQQIKSNLLLEELLTRDVKISEEEKKKFYEENQELYKIPTAYHLSQIIVSSKHQANVIRKELKGGSTFAVLAMEKSLDEFTANQGGDMGFLSADNEQAPKEYLKAAAALKNNSWSRPIKLKDGWAVIYLHEKISGEQFSFSESKKQIRRQIALEQLNMPISSKVFWNEMKVDWYYGKNK
ncbi:peptidyl-prolyl cis-trans isomerase [Bacillus sp. MUM 13]|uniref:peptidyl-prolyl cis-trans isomerase n=1 Tax=Bacillus sp. MUM 13 TaxID=1678001 RepID=UPI0008F5C135|nr:peptidyl-prolyl cis-trans isomerase [Bacillus sp. MUM 13]OIK08753.1 peptidylprolyl isomerase [Bacillus sp. MUM 13]